MPAAAVPVNTLAMTALGNIIGIEPRVLECPFVSVLPYDTMINAMWPLENIDAVKYATFIVLVFKVAAEHLHTILPELFIALQAELCDIVGVAHHGDGKHTAVCRRTQQRIKFKLPAEMLNIMEITMLHSFKLQGRSSAQVAALTYEFLQAWGGKGGDYHVNFQTNELVVWTSDLLMLVWAEYSNDEIQRDILHCEDNVVMKRPFTPREHYVSKMGRKVAAYMKELRSTTHTCQELTSNPELMDLESFSHLDAVVCRTFDVVTGALIQYPVMDWIRQGWFKSHTLILHGDAGLGKTPLAMALLAAVSNHLQSDSPWAPYFLKVGTVESLRDASTLGLMKCKIPILFDDLSPDQACGSSKGMPLHVLKLILEVTQSSGFSARFKDLTFATEEPRIFTANALNPCQWHKGLPTDPFFACSDASRRALDLNVKAAFKRSCFAFVGHALVGEASREQHQRARRNM